ncbi:isoprenylcysteine carboxylmethyltransferase family protein [Phenylobacterium sp.]|uniref:methyltransferase family protein n=1 Tax=Phenylobacterium sp. TaxID=1871053 RepID=UPI0027361BC5|nr:isoprenylcysteine carboxylmethyltransferase family protein [Phenylobacterium sp.]MDP3855556.1 isoprenylcysteine carboxylmethyltransferase family protein [Phenylobacterium sp.]
MRLLPPPLVLILLVVMGALRLAWPGAILLPSPLNWLGLLPGALGVLLLLQGSGLFRRIGTNIQTFNEPGVLVTDGPFRLTRNPMYLGFLLLLIGVAVLLGAASPFAGPAVFAAASQFVYIPFEEKALRAKFGEAYEAYARRVRRWI